MKVLSIFKRTSDFLDSIVMKLVFASIVGMILSISFQIFFRVFFNALTWTEEVSRYLLVWSTFLASTLAYKRNMHISVTVFVDVFKKRSRKIIVALSILLSLIFFSTIALYGYKYMAMQSAQVSAAMRMPMKWIYIVIPVSSIIMFIHGITLMLEEIFKEEVI